MDYLEQKVREIFPNLGWEVEIGTTTITLTFNDYKVLITKNNNAYYWLCRKINREVENIAGGVRGARIRILRSME